MEGKKKNIMMMMMMMVMGIRLVVGQDGNGTTATPPIPFTDCYTRCFFFCIIEPQNFCTCGSTCLKKCLDTPSTTTMAMAMGMDQHAQNLAYCKFGCASSLCSNISKLHNPDGESMGSCVDSCSSKCTMSYQLGDP